MKKTITLLVVLLTLGSQSFAQKDAPKALGLPGDNFNLYAALKLFQESKTLEAFEKKINDPEEKLNNLDLDGNDEIDYINVIDQVKDNVHSITLRVNVNKDEQQDIAVFVVTREADNKVTIQVVGDEDLYGKDYIIEPNYPTEGTPNPGYQPNVDVEYVPAQRNTITYVEVAQWPIVQYIYVPTYRPWVSNWGWNRYPSWWRPWRPYTWHWYYGYHYNYFNIYFGYYNRTQVFRNRQWYSWHYGNNGWRVRSVVYTNRYQQGFYRTTYARPQTFQQGFVVSRDRVPVNMRPAPIPAPRPPMVNQRPSRPFDTDNDRDRPYNRPGFNSRPSPATRPGLPLNGSGTVRPDVSDRDRPIGPSRPTPSQRPATETRPYRPAPGNVPNTPAPQTRPSRPTPESGPAVRPNPSQRPAPVERPGSTGRGSRNGTGTSRDND